MRQLSSSSAPSAPRRGAAFLSLLLAVCLGCSSAAPKAGTASDLDDPNAARYRLQLRENPVDPGQAFRCYGQCQSQDGPKGYLQCLTECPGFETVTSSLDVAIWQTSELLRANALQQSLARLGARNKAGNPTQTIAVCVPACATARRQHPARPSAT